MTKSKRKLTIDEHVKYLSMSLEHAGIKLTDSVVRHIIKTNEVIMKHGGNCTIADIAQLTSTFRTEFVKEQELQKQIELQFDIIMQTLPARAQNVLKEYCRNNAVTLTSDTLANVDLHQIRLIRRSGATTVKQISDAAIVIRSLINNANYATLD